MAQVDATLAGRLIQSKKRWGKPLINPPNIVRWRNGRRKYTVVTIDGDCIETDTQGYITRSNRVLTTKQLKIKQ